MIFILSLKRQNSYKVETDIQFREFLLQQFQDYRDVLDFQNILVLKWTRMIYERRLGSEFLRIYRKSIFFEKIQKQNDQDAEYTIIECYRNCVYSIKCGDNVNLFIIYDKK
ncbi:unnamed protein product [Paramecium sonneborni]|uniref:Uncharacterized protein n=1 Tax=Paramecium sonneborni TaxID=65129 RepID=A0A8S1PNU5_9CILI|nr:unnamed protein product [Paramecium sonneborni]